VVAKADNAVFAFPEGDSKNRRGEHTERIDKMKVCLVAIFSMIATAFAPGSSQAKIWMQINCEPFKGVNLSYGWQYSLHGETQQSPKNGVVQSKDGISRQYPFFFNKRENPRELFVRFGSTIPDGMTREQVENISPTKLTKATVVQVNRKIITAIEISGTQVWMYSFYPKLGYVQVAVQGVKTGFKGEQLSYTKVFGSKCTFG